MKAMLAVILAAILAQVAPQSTTAPSAGTSPTPSSTPTGPVYFGNPAAHFTVDAQPMGFDPDGNAQWRLVAHYTDASGLPTRIMANGDVDWKASRGFVQWQTRMRYGQPAAIVRTNVDGPLTATIRSNVPSLGTVTLQTNPQTWPGPRVVAEALGPHLVQVGWFPQERKLVRVVRIDGNGVQRTVGVIAGS
ncbi:MAG: hypothetical protein ACXVAW_19340, partial [Vulcanimicrobiaceae bacterium]